MRTDKNGIYHANFDCWQSVWGYNDAYDKVFNTFTSMERAKFDFTSGDKDYMLWVWKGDYLNLGAGAEMGIYYDSLIPGHWGVDKSLAMTMALILQYTDPTTNKTSTIINYSPSDKQWWLTGFNPNYQGVNAGNLRAIYSITFNTQAMYTDFYKAWGGVIDSRWKWTFDPKTTTATLTF
jgi:hypothetical protein